MTARKIKNNPDSHEKSICLMLVFPNFFPTATEISPRRKLMTAIRIILLLYMPAAMPAHSESRESANASAKDSLAESIFEWSLSA